MLVCLRCKYEIVARIPFAAYRAPCELRVRRSGTGPTWLWVCAGLAFFVLPQTAFAACSPAGPAIVSGATVNCNVGGTQAGRIGNGPAGAPGNGDGVTVNVNNGAIIDVKDLNAISLHNNAIITVGSVSGTATTTVETDTDAGANSGQYSKGDNTIEFNNNSVLTIYANGRVVASGTEETAEAINPIGSGNTIINRGLIKAGASSAIFFENIDTSGGRNSVDNFGTIDARGGSNPTTGGEAIGSFGAVGIDIINETGASIFGNLDMQGGNDTVTLKTGSTITGNLDGGGGTNLLDLDAAAGASDSLPGVVKNFQTLNKSGAGTWTLTGTVGQSSGAPLVMNVLGGTLVLTGNNATFNGSVIIDPGATLEARAQSLPPTINDLSGDLLINQESPDGIQPNDGTYAGHIIGTGIVTKIGVGTLTLTGANTYSGGTIFDVGAIAASADSAFGAATGPLTFNGGELKLLSSFNLAATRAITLNGPGSFAGGGTIDANGFQTTIAQGITGAGGLTIADSSGSGAGRVILTGANTYGGGTTIAAGTLQLGNGGTTGSIIGNVVDNGALAFDRSDAVTFPGLISGTGSVSQIGSGMTILTADNTYGGGTTISAGTLQLGDGGVTGAIVGNVVDNGTLSFDRFNEMIFPGAISGGGAVSQIGSGGTILTADSSYTGGTTIASGFLQLGLGGTTGSIVGDVADNGSLVFDRSNEMTFGGVISGSGAVVQAGFGTTILTGASTYLGGTTITGGTLQLGDGGATGSIVGDVSVLGAGGLAFDRSDAVTFAGVVSGTGSVHQTGSGSTTLTAANTYSGVTILSNGTLIAGNNSALGTGKLIVTPGPLGGRRRSTILRRRRASRTQSRLICYPISSSAGVTS